MSDDLIKREDAIKALRCEYPTMPIFKGLREEWAIKTEGFRKAEEVIMNLPSADRPQGEWIFDPEIPVPDKGVYFAGYICSVCGKDYFKVDGMNYCPHCGAHMKGADDEV